jgi:hypothetical protein
MYQSLKNTGVKYRKTNDGQIFLLEWGDIIAAWTKFLRAMHNMSICGDECPISYLDETWVHQNHSRKNTWQDLTDNGGLKVPLRKGSRITMCHIGYTKTTFIPKSRWVFCSCPQSCGSNYQSQMNANTLKEWFWIGSSIIERRDQL